MSLIIIIIPDHQDKFENKTKNTMEMKQVDLQSGVNHLDKTTMETQSLHGMAGAIHIEPMTDMKELHSNK